MSKEKATKLAAQYQKPVAWLDPEELKRLVEAQGKRPLVSGLYRLHPSKEFDDDVAIYLSPPPAAGVIKALEIIAGERPPFDNLMGYADLARAALKALRHNAPPDTGAGANQPQIMKMLCCPQGCLRVDDCVAERGPGSLERKRQCAALLKSLPAHGGADAGVREALEDAKECCDLAAKEPCPDCPNPVIPNASAEDEKPQPIEFGPLTWQMLVSTNAKKDLQLRWRHKKRGTTYTEIGRGKVQSEDWRTPDGSYVDMTEIVIYRANDDGSLWARPVVEFEDGRFEAVNQGKPELLELAEWARAVPGLLSGNSPAAKHFIRIAEILEALAKQFEGTAGK